MSLLPAYLVCTPGSHLMVALNGNKSEAILFGTRQRLHAFLQIQSVSIPDSQVHRHNISQNSTVLGVTLDSTLSLNKHTSPICQSVYFHMSALRLVRSALSEDTETALAVYTWTAHSL